MWLKFGQNSTGIGKACILHSTPSPASERPQQPLSGCASSPMFGLIESVRACRWLDDINVASILIAPELVNPSCSELIYLKWQQNSPFSEVM